ncbi:MAG: S9 family peptidase [Acidobacteriaceae bacterium]|nr:S9 family peptidase [Acidobacteriaceae bacterium]
MLLRVLVAFCLLCPLFGQKRAFTPDDYDDWRHIQNQQLSNDGHYLAYAVFPQQGDGELIVRDLVTGKELHEPIGELPPPPRPNFANPPTGETPAPPPPGIAVRFTPDSGTLVVSTFAPRAEVEKAKREKRKPEDMPKGDIVVITLGFGSVFRAPGVKNFQVPSAASGWVAYLQIPEKLATEIKPIQEPAQKSDTPKPKKVEAGDLVLRNLGDGTERRFSGVSEYSFTRDAKFLVYAVGIEKSETAGVYSVTPGSSSSPTTLLAGKGKYEKLVWDEDQTRLAFLSDRDDALARQPRFKLYTWDRHSAAAVAVVSAATPGFPAGWILSEHGNITIAKGGDRIFFGTAPRRAGVKLPDDIPADERVSVDLWSWKDDYIQPMQKVRAAVERDRSYVAVYGCAEKRPLQLAGLAMNEVIPNEDGTFAIGNDDRAYRRMPEYDTSYADSYLVNTATGARKLIARKHIGRLNWSPDGRHAIYYDGKDWIAITPPSADSVNLTAKLGVAMGNELHDTPSYPPAYGLAGWTKDGKNALINDRFDIWQCTLDGTSAVNITHGLGRKEHVVFRIVRFRFDDDPESRWIDPAKPLLLRAESDDTHDSGFYVTALNASAAPTRLVMQAKDFVLPIKAHDAEVYVTAAGTFSEYPDLVVTDGTFHDLNRVSNANPQLANFLWGTAELLPYASDDGIPLKAILYKPANFDPHKHYPMLVYIYERLSQNVHHFLEPRPANVISPSQYASNGYLVLEPDITYQIGSPGESALHCVLPAIQAVVDLGFVDEKAIGIQGHSWGGYQIAYMVTRTNRFRAAAAGAPVADMISSYDGIRWGPGTPRQFQYEHTQSRIGGTPWEYPMRYIENSPIFMADHVTTPLLMIQNDADDAVPWYQGIEFFLALRRLNREVYMFSYNGEPHNLRRRANQKDYALRLQQFFDYYLKGASKPDWMEHGIPYLEKQGATISADSDQQ